ncbi:MAG: DUF3488 and transglutaminase-like domain-containing protein [Desulfuromonadaceae bacterium]|jgi:hypothetical protein|nr:DUF3488 and transglutaminase-like domain-containing protein [Desulfuromonas sp.]MDY0184282.1 DUF3488 and transglutaminase-like domain-containing protein [Desulfuromonadaceae bacterium]
MLRIKTLLDILTYLVVALAVIPLFPWLDGAVQLSVVVVFCAGLLADRRQRYLLAPRLATVLTFAFFAIYLVQLNLNNVVSPVINLLALLLCIRLATEKQGRHYLQIFVLALFCLAGSSLLSLSMLYLPALILMIFGVTIGLVVLTFFQRDPSLRLNRAQSTSLLKTAAILPIGSLLLMLALFFVLPRTQFPLWNFLNPDASATTGFSEQVRPGAFASNATSKSLAFRAECEKIGAEDLYWRGTVLNTIEGSTWKRTIHKQEATQLVGGKSITCTITLPATDKQFLFTLDRPSKLDGIQYQHHSDQVFMARQALRKSVSYRCESRLGGALQVLSTPDTKLYLDVPANVSPQVQQVADRIQQQAKTPQQRIALLEEFFLQQQLNYATTDLPGATAPIEQFLFVKKRGYCEFFASSFGLLLRLCDIPARLVGGYHGGEYNNFGGYYLITEDLAHVWVEALVDEQWQRIDPSRLAANASTTLLAARQQGLSLAKRTMDSLEYLWTQMVISYDFNTQVSLVRASGSQLKNLVPRTATLIRTGLIILALLLGGAAVLWLRAYQRLTPQQRLLKRYQQAVQQRYQLANIPSASGLVELAMELDDPRCLTFARRYSAMLYGKQPFNSAEYRDLNSLIAEIRQGQS